MTETDTYMKGSIELYPVEATVEGTKVEYTSDVHSNLWPDTGTGRRADVVNLVKSKSCFILKQLQGIDADTFMHTVFPLNKVQALRCSLL